MLHHRAYWTELLLFCASRSTDLLFRSFLLVCCTYFTDILFRITQFAIMKTINLLAPLFCSVALAQDAQIPLKEKAQQWFDVAKSYIPSGVPSIPNPVDAGAAAVAGNKVQKISIANFERVLAPKPEGEEEWLIYTTGGNKTCFGRCGKVDLAWNVCAVSLPRYLPGTNANNIRRSPCHC